MNYYVDVDDTRSLQEVINTGIEPIKERFIKQFPKGATHALIGSWRNGQVIDIPSYPCHG